MYDRYSYTINNPNNLEIKNTDYYAIPFGHRCTSALACKYASIRHFSLPFDWTIPTYPKKIKNVLENNFEDFIPDVYNNTFKNKYDISLVHFNSDINSGVEEYKRRIERFNNIMAESHKKKYFVYINEDYLTWSDYRDPKKNETIFNEMLELELFLKEKYPNIDYNILYFNFIKHDIPANSNIINIVLGNNSEFYSNEIQECSPVHAEQLRNYCGYILTTMFNTELILGYTWDDFKN
jgi:hypothetical protein